MTIDKIATLDPEFAKVALRIVLRATPYVKQIGYDGIQIVTGRVTMNDQAKLYVCGRHVPGTKVTNIKPGHSPHNYGKAFDFVLIKDGKQAWDAPLTAWKIVGKIAKRNGCIWGRNFRHSQEVQHIEDPSWKNDFLKWKDGLLDPE